MVRRWFRLGLRVGVLLGVTVAFVKLVQSRRATGEGEGDGWKESPDAWSPPASTAPPVETPAKPAAAAPPPPVASPPRPAAAPPQPAAARPQPAAVPPPPAAAPPVTTPPARPVPVQSAETPAKPAAAVAEATKPAPAPKAPVAKAAKVANSPKPAKVAKRAAKKSPPTPRAEWDERVLGLHAASPGDEERWVTPEEDRCPASHPLKAKLSSRIFHVPGMLAYDRTRPDRCYRDEAAAVADGFTKAKR